VVRGVRIGGVIIDHLTDLRRMPSEPDPGKAGVVLGQALVRANGQVVGAQEVRDGPGTGITFGI
jgi:phosphoribosylformimino-5-aminoimidazole carboxamide ribonucleotide (ProFAR) isomerase